MALLPNPVGVSLRIFLADGGADGIWVAEKSVTEVSLLNEVLDRIAAIEARLAELTSADTSAAGACDATAGALQDFGQGLATLERTLAQTASAADIARERRLEHLARSYSDALQAVVAEVPNATIRSILRDHLGRATGVVEVQP